jgi:hypothetical protein
LTRCSSAWTLLTPLTPLRTDIASLPHPTSHVVSTKGCEGDEALDMLFKCFDVDRTSALDRHEFGKLLTALTQVRTHSLSRIALTYLLLLPALCGHSLSRAALTQVGLLAITRFRHLFAAVACVQPFTLTYSHCTHAGGSTRSHTCTLSPL